MAGDECCPRSCDTFVVLPPGTALGCVVFGKNSDRPRGEVQEVVYHAAEEHPPGSKLQICITIGVGTRGAGGALAPPGIFQTSSAPPEEILAPHLLTCTYISVEQVSKTRAVILSKPAWMWGAEMGANDAGVCIGNEAVFTRLNDPQKDVEEKLLGMDLVRLGLERSSTAREAVDVITGLLEEYGQGGPCADTNPSWTYYNSFLIADPSEAWVLETAGQLWAAEHVTSGCRNISNCLTIGTKIDLMSKDLKSHAESNGFWDSSQGDLNFAEAYGTPHESANQRLNRGKELLTQLSESGEFGTLSMFQVLRDCDSEICRGADHEFPTAGSQVSVLAPRDSERSSCHWFTGTPDPAHSVFKPFVFCSSNRISRHIVSPTFPDNEDPAKMQPRFQNTVDRSHTLYKKHKAAYPILTSDNPKGKEIVSVLRRLETQCVEDMEKFVENFTSDKAQEVEDLFKDLVESEMKFYYIK